MFLQGGKFSRLWVITVLCTLLLPISSLVEASTESLLEEGAKTPPPPIDIEITGAFDPRHQYLEDGRSTITDMGNGRVELWGRTTASKRVHTIGVKFYLQKWTGSRWVNVDSRVASYTDSNYRTLEANEYKSVEEGYYYRVKSVHWIHEGTTSEEGERYSGSLLIK